VADVDDRERGTEPGARGDPQQVRIGQRIAKDPWYVPPATANMEPASSPITIRGARSVQTTVDWVDVSVL